MGFKVKDEKLFLVCSLVIMVVVISAFGYGWIMREEARTGGMGEKWHVAVTDSYQPNLDMIRPDGSMLFTDRENHLISLVDGNGVAEWSHDYGSELLSYDVVDNDIYLLDVSYKTGNYSLECLDLNGIWISSTPCPQAYGFVHGDDGGVYAFGHENDRSSIYNIQGGFIKWNFTQNGSLGIYKVWNDGKVLLKHIHYDQNFTVSSSGPGFDVDEAILLSPEGIPLWSVQFPTDLGFYGSSYAMIADNGTIVMTYQHGEMIHNEGRSVTGESLWSYDEPMDQSSTDGAYYGCQTLGGYGGHEFIESVYRSDPANHSYFWNILLNDTMDGSVYEMQGMIVFVSNDGQAFAFDQNGTMLWHIQTTVYSTPQCLVVPGQGILVRSDNLVTKIGLDGSFWTYDGLDSSVNDLRFGPNNTVYVLTYDKMVVLDKPIVSTPTEYMITMLSVDLLVCLSSMLWIADRLVKKPN